MYNISSLVIILLHGIVEYVDSISYFLESPVKFRLVQVLTRNNINSDSSSNLVLEKLPYHWALEMNEKNSNRWETNVTGMAIKIWMWHDDEGIWTPERFTSRGIRFYRIIRRN